MSETPEQELKRIVAFEAWIDSVRGQALGPLEGFNGGWAAAQADLATHDAQEEQG